MFYHEVCSLNICTYKKIPTASINDLRQKLAVWGRKKCNGFSLYVRWSGLSTNGAMLRFTLLLNWVAGEACSGYIYVV